VIGALTVTPDPCNFLHLASEILIPEESWQDRSAYRATARKLADLFIKNFLTFESGVSAAVKAAGPQ